MFLRIVHVFLPKICSSLLAQLQKTNQVALFNKYAFVLVIKLVNCYSWSYCITIVKVPKEFFEVFENCFFLPNQF